MIDYVGSRQAARDRRHGRVISGGGQGRSREGALIHLFRPFLALVVICSDLQGLTAKNHDLFLAMKPHLTSLKDTSTFVLLVYLRTPRTGRVTTCMHYMRPTSNTIHEDDPAALRYTVLDLVRPLFDVVFLQ